MRLYRVRQRAAPTMAQERLVVLEAAVRERELGETWSLSVVPRLSWTKEDAGQAPHVVTVQPVTAAEIALNATHQPPRHYGWAGNVLSTLPVSTGVDILPVIGCRTAASQ